MNKTTNLKTISKSISGILDKDPAKLNMFPYRDWGIIVVLFFLMVIVVSAINYFEFIAVYSEDVYIVSEEISVDNNNKDDGEDFRIELAKLLNFYGAKKNKLDAMLHQGLMSTPDPALIYWDDELSD